MLRARCILLAFVALALLGAASQSSQPPTPRPIEPTQPQQRSSTAQQSDTTAERSPSERSVTAIAKDQSQSEERSAEGEAKRRRDDAAQDRRTMQILTGIMAASAAVQLVVIAFQAWFAHKTRVATEEAAEAALRSAKATERAIIDVERPRLVVMPQELSNWEIDRSGRLLMFQMQADEALMRRPRGECVILNYGKMPAWIVRSCIQFEVVAVPIPASPTYRDYTNLGGVPLAPIATVANQMGREGRDLTITPRQQGGVGSTVQAMFYGAIEYRGIFQDAETYLTRFCFVVEEGWDSARLVFGGPSGWTEYT